MHSAFHAVARGLRIAHAGYLLTCWGATSAIVLSWLVGQVGWRDDPLRATLWGAFWLNVLIGVGGVVSGIVGRVKCLKAPAEYPTVRGRAIAAVVLEASGWFSGFVGVGVIFAMGYKQLPQEFWVPAVGIGFSVVLLLCGRILFLRFLRVLAGVVEDTTTARRARGSLALFLADWGAGLLAWGVGAGGSMLSVQEMTTPLAVAISILTGMSGMLGLVLYDRVLGGLTRSVQAFGDVHRDDEEELYRARKERDEEDERRDEPAADAE